LLASLGLTIVLEGGMESYLSSCSVTIIRTLLFLTCSLSTLSAQFADVKVSLDVQRLKERDRRITAELPDQIKLFFKSAPWDQEYSDLTIPLAIQLIFESVSDKGGEHLYSSQCLFSNGSDQRYFAKVIQFPYASGQAVIFSPVLFEPLASALEYYGNIILAAEADTYDQFGGTRFYERGRELALRGITSQYRRGWGDRVELVDILTRNKGTRLARFFFFDALAYLDEDDLEEAEASLDKMMENLELIFAKFPREHYTIIFLKGHAEKLSQLPDQLRNKKKLLTRLIELDPDNKARYREGLGIKSE